jgi:alanine racemase
MNRRNFLATGSAAAALLALPFRRVAGQAAPPPAAPAGFAPWLEVSPAALAHNAETLARLAGGRPIIAVVKNNAYGLGLDVAGPLLARLPQVVQLAVVRPEEALLLRRTGVRKPILLMGPATEEELLELVRLNVVQSPYRDIAPALLGRVARRAGRPVRVHLYVDTGMHRMGVPAESAPALLDALARTPGVQIEGAFTELTEEPDIDRQQAARLATLRDAARTRGIIVPTLHAASSDAVMHQTTDAFLDAIRPGLALYGGYVSERVWQEGALRPAGTLKTRVIRVDRLRTGDGVSYHHRYVADREHWTATLAVGHVDGYPSGAVRGGEVFARGRLYRVIGTVSASHTIIDLGAEQSLQVGDEVTLVGTEHPVIHPNEVGKRSGWSAYNMFMHLPRELRRVVRDPVSSR